MPPLTRSAPIDQYCVAESHNYARVEWPHSSSYIAIFAQGVLALGRSDGSQPCIVRVGAVESRVRAQDLYYRANMSSSPMQGSWTDDRHHPKGGQTTFQSRSRDPLMNLRAPPRGAPPPAKGS